MKAVLCKEWGGPETLAFGDVEPPSPGPGEIKVAVKAAGVNFADTLMIAGTYQVKPPFPFVPGLEVAGEVIGCGEGVSRVRPGDRVMGFARHGCFAEEAVVEEMAAVPLAPEIDDITAAAMPVVYGTSHVGLTYRAGLKPDETLLVLGAAGGVGLSAVEIGRAVGATVIAAASSTEKLALAETHGAHHLVNYAEEDLRERVKALTDGRGADVIFDPVGGDAFDAAMRCIAWEGRILVIGFASGRIPQAACNIVLVKNISIVGFPWGAYAGHNPELLRDSLAELVSWHTEGKVNPHVSHVLPLAEAGQALELLMTRRSTGKVVLSTGDD